MNYKEVRGKEICEEVVIVRGWFKCNDSNDNGKVNEGEIREWEWILIFDLGF